MDLTAVGRRTIQVTSVVRVDIESSKVAGWEHLPIGTRAMFVEEYYSGKWMLRLYDIIDGVPIGENFIRSSETIICSEDEFQDEALKYGWRVLSVYVCGVTRGTTTGFWVEKVAERPDEFPAPETHEEELARIILEYGGREISRIRGEVEEDNVNGDTERMIVELESGERRIFPAERLRAAGVEGVGFKIEYIIYALGALRMSVIENVSPSLEELLSKDWVTIPQEDLKELDSW